MSRHPDRIGRAVAGAALVARRSVEEEAARAGRQVEAARESVGQRLRPRPRHRVRNGLLVVSGVLGFVTLAAGLVGRRKSSAPSPARRAGLAARETIDRDRSQEGSVGLGGVAAGAAAVAAAAEGAEEDVVRGARAVRDAPGNAVHEKVEAVKAVADTAKERVVGKLVRICVLAGIAFTVYVLVMAVVVALIVDAIV